MFCEKCGTKNEEGARFCGECGSPLPPSEPAYRRQYQPDTGPDHNYKTVRKDKGVYALMAAAIVLGVLIVVMAAVLVKTSYDAGSREDEELEALMAEADVENEGEGTDDVAPEPSQETTPEPTAEAVPQVTAAPTQEAAPAPTQETVPETAPTEEYVAVKYGLQAPASDFMFPYSSERLLTQAELDTMEDASVEVMHSKSQLAINEILARYGYSFNPDTSDTAREIYSRVSGKEWYQQAQQQCSYSDSNSLIADMNAVEKENINMINTWQQEHGCYY
ncbi:MAG: zinc-ribbon domain-containing protein [Ruminococcus sp.]|jgi:hypothetical protein